ncbi:MAG: hypothetical protein WBF18_08705 [Solirubrobacterales bacterium]
MSAFYEAVGRIVVTMVRIRVRRQLRIAAALAVAGTIAAGYFLATREAEEG